MIKVCNKLFKRKVINDFDAFFKVESIHFFVFSISYTVPEIILKNIFKINTKNGSTKNLIFN